MSSTMDFETCVQAESALINGVERLLSNGIKNFQVHERPLWTTKTKEFFEMLLVAQPFTRRTERNWLEFLPISIYAKIKCSTGEAVSDTLAILSKMSSALGLTNLQPTEVGGKYAEEVRALVVRLLVAISEGFGVNSDYLNRSFATARISITTFYDLTDEVFISPAESIFDEKHPALYGGYSFGEFLDDVSEARD
eukprot:Gb_03784 [translate_table: standard]